MTVDEVLNIYVSKCKDNGMVYNAEQALVFINKVSLCCDSGQLNLKRQRLAIASVSVVCAILSNNTHFMSVLLGQNQIGDEGAALVSSMLQVNTCIIHLDLTSNGIGD